MDFMLYPTFEFDENRGQWFPNITLPVNYKELIPNFYKQERKDVIEKYAKSIEEKLFKNLEIRLKWDDEKGLTNIGIGPSGGLDLSEQFGYPHFAEHNLGTKTSIAYGIIFFFSF